ncbi:MAG: YtxH domain-containing protein [Anaerolineales bacterium]|jgi:gas vesicle protein
MRRFFSFVAGAMCGALVGSITALLLAPASGEELRGEIRDRSAAFRDEVREAYEARVAQLEAELEQMRSRMAKS